MDKSVYSAGARYERAAMRKYLERKINTLHSAEFALVLKWVRARETRYDKKPGGL